MRKINGIGFDINSIPTYSHGLSGMKRRAESIGAVVEIQSDLGKGSKIYLKGKTQVNLKWCKFHTFILFVKFNIFASLSQYI